MQITQRTKGLLTSRAFSLSYLIVLLSVLRVERKMSRKKGSIKRAARSMKTWNPSFVFSVFGNCFSGFKVKWLVSWFPALAQRKTLEILREKLLNWKQQKINFSRLIPQHSFSRFCDFCRLLKPFLFALSSDFWVFEVFSMSNSPFLRSLNERWQFETLLSQH